MHFFFQRIAGLGFAAALLVFGSGPASTQFAPPLQPASVAAAMPTAEPTLATVAMPVAPEAPAVEPAPMPEPQKPLVGRLEERSFYSPILDLEEPYFVYLPPGYDASTQAYPTIYMLHGAGGSYTEWRDSFLPEQLDRLILNGEIGPMIAVLPSGGDRTYWANWAGDGPRWLDYLVTDVVGEIDSHFRTIDDPRQRAVGGLSMGGLGALNAAMHHPEIFGIVGAHSPSIRLAPEPDVPFLLGENFRQHSPIWLAWNMPNLDQLDIWIDVGEADGWRGNIEELDLTLGNAGIKHIWRVFPGTHESAYWIDNLPSYLRFYDLAFNDRPSLRAMFTLTR